MAIKEIRKAPSIIECVKMFFQNYVNFSGRSRRAEYWKVWLFNIIIQIPLYLVLGSTLVAIIVNPSIANHPEDILASVGVGAIVVALIYGLYALACIIPFLSLLVRRLHDVNLSGYYALLLLAACIPFIGFLVNIGLIVLMFIDSKPGTNQYGPSVKYVEEDESMIESN